MAAGYDVLVLEIACRSETTALEMNGRCRHSVPPEKNLKMHKMWDNDPKALCLAPWVPSAPPAAGSPPPPSTLPPSSNTKGAQAAANAVGRRSPSPPDRTRSADQAQSDQDRERAVTVLNSVAYNGEMRQQLLDAGCVDVFAPMLHLPADAELPTNEYMRALRAIAKLVGQEEDNQLLHAERCVGHL